MPTPPATVFPYSEEALSSDRLVAPKSEFLSEDDPPEVQAFWARVHAGRPSPDPTYNASVTAPRDPMTINQGRPHSLPNALFPDHTYRNHRPSLVAPAGPAAMASASYRRAASEDRAVVPATTTVYYASSGQLQEDSEGVHPVEGTETESEDHYEPYSFQGHEADSEEGDEGDSVVTFRVTVTPDEGDPIEVLRIFLTPTPVRPRLRGGDEDDRVIILGFCHEGGFGVDEGL